MNPYHNTTIKHTIVQKVFPPGIELGTLSVLDSRDNHYTTETWTFMLQKGHHKNNMLNSPP